MKLFNGNMPDGYVKSDAVNEWQLSTMLNSVKHGKTVIFDDDGEEGMLTEVEHYSCGRRHGYGLSEDDIYICMSTAS
jgi:hypothetical protein